MERNCRTFVSIPFKRESVFRGRSGKRGTLAGRSFQFPSNGKVYSEFPGPLGNEIIQFMFQFPSNGKVYSEFCCRGSCWLCPLAFQFPSNGKVYSESRRMGYGCPEGIWVSIPFKRESVFRDSAKRVWTRRGKKRFNSLQTGKCIQRAKETQGKQPWKYGFNSLQTGKCIQSESKQREKIAQKVFQFPSNGKVYSEWIFVASCTSIVFSVSIPFKRESVFRALTTNGFKWVERRVSIPFKRESVFRDLLRRSSASRRKVSIPFKRESVFRVECDCKEQ